MFGKSFKLFTLLGFEVKIDLSWLILAVLVTWSLAVGIFPERFPNQATGIYWAMGVGGALGLFVSIVFHEFWHSLIARRYGLPMHGITLFIFGGVAEMSEQPQSPKVEFLMAIAGPISSVVLAGIFLLLAGAIRGEEPIATATVLALLGRLNIVLAIFNMIPAFPLDGGRVLRSILWYAKGDIRWATNIASKFGSGFGIFLIGVGVLNLLFGNIISAIWMALIGMFIRGASKMSYQQVLMKSGLEGETVERFMKEPVTVPASISVRELVEEYFYRYHYKMFPVVRETRLAGCVNTRSVKDIPRENWDSHAVAELVQNCGPSNSIPAHTDAMEALNLMNRTGNSRLMVVDGERLLGIITLKDMLDFLSLKLDLEK